MSRQATHNSRIVATAFRESLDNIILVSTKQHETVTIRNVAYAAREKGYPPTEVLYVFLLTCKVSGHRSSYRNLLFHCLFDLCKFFSLNVMTITNMEARAVCDMVRCLAFVRTASARAEKHGDFDNRCTSFVHGSDNSREKGGAVLANRSFSVFPSESDLARSQSNVNTIDQKELVETRLASTIREKASTFETSVSTVNASHALCTLVEDDEMVMQLLHVVVALSSVCPLSSSVLVEPLGLLLTMYASVAPGCMAEEVLRATLMQHTHAYCDALLHGEGEFDVAATGDASQSSTMKSKSSLPLLLQSVAYFKDLCDLSAGQWPKSLPLSTVPLGSHGLLTPQLGNNSSTAFQAWFDLIETVKSSQPQQTESSFIATVLEMDNTRSFLLDVPYRLRKVALELLVSYFTDVEGEVATSTKPALSQAFPRSVTDEERTVSSSLKSDSRVVMLENPSSSVGVWFFQCLNEKVVGLALACRPYSTGSGVGEGIQDSHSLIYGTDKGEEDQGKTAASWDQDPASTIYDVFDESSHHVQSARIARRATEVLAHDELFVLTQELALVALSKFPIAMRNTASDLAGYHAILLKEFRIEHLPTILERIRSQLVSADTHVSEKTIGYSISKEALEDSLHYKDEDMMFVIFRVLAVWKKIVEGDSLAKDLFLANCTLNRILQEESAENYDQRSGESFTTSNPVRSHCCAYTALFSEAALLAGDMIEGISTPLSALAHPEHHPLQELSGVAESKPPSEELAGGVKQKKPEVSGELPTGLKGGRSSAPRSKAPAGPAALGRTRKCLSHLVDLTSLLGVFVRRLTQIVEKLSSHRGEGEKGGVAHDSRTDSYRQRERILRHVFMVLHPPLLRCVQSYLERIEGVDEMLHRVLTITAECVYLCGMLGLLEKQQEYLHALIGALYTEDAVGDMLINLMQQQHPEAAAMWERSASQTGVWLKEASDYDTSPAKPQGAAEGNRAPATARDPQQTTFLRHWVANKVRRISINFSRGAENVRRTNPLTPSFGSEATIAFSPVASRASLFKENELALSVAIEGLQRRLVILKSLFVLSRRMVLHGHAWSIVAEALCFVEPLIYRLHLFLLWIPADSAERQEHEKLLCDAYEMRDTMHDLCVECAQQLQEEPFAEFLDAMVRATEQFCSRTQDRLYRIFHPESGGLFTESGTQDGKIPHNPKNSPPESSSEPFLKTFPDGFGVFGQIELMCESLCVVYLFLLPVHAARAGLVGRQLRWLCARVMHPSRLARWCALLQQWPLAISPLAWWGAPAHAASEAPAVTPSLPTRVRREGGGGSMTGFPNPSAGLEELHHALMACVGDVAGVAAFASRWGGRLRAALTAAAEKNPAIGGITTGRELFAEVVEPTLPAGLLLSGRLAKLVKRSRRLFSSAYGSPSLPTASLQSNDSVGGVASSVDALAMDKAQWITTEQMLQRLSDNLIRTAMGGVEFFSFIQEMYDFFSDMPIREGNGNNESEQLLGSKLGNMEVESEGFDTIPIQQRSQQPSLYFIPQHKDTHQSAHLRVSLGLSIGTLREVLCLVQCCGEYISSEPWRHLMRMLRKAVTTASMSSIATAAPTRSLAGACDDKNRQQDTLLSSKTKNPLPPTGINDRSSRAVSVSSVQPESIATLPVPLSLLHTAYTATLGDIVQLAYRILEVIQHNYINNMHTDELRELILCASAFIAHNVGGIKSKQLHINLSAVQMIWSIADYLVSVSMSSDFSDPDSRQDGSHKLMDAALDNPACVMAQHDWDVLSCVLLLHLHDEGCMDTRQEVRQSAQKTLFSILQTYGGYFSGDCWHYVLRDMMVPLMDVVFAAQMKCMITGDPSLSLSSEATTTVALQDESPNRDRSIVCVSPKLKGEAGYAALLDSLEAEPRQIEEMRVIITDSIGRVLLSHYSNIRTTLQSRNKDVNASTCFNKSLLYEVLFQFIYFCGESRVVVRSTSGVDSALSAIRALHSLVVELFGGGRDFDDDAIPLVGTRLAWQALHGIFLRDARTKHTARKQCTDAVVSELLGSLCNTFCMHRRKLRRSRSAYLLSSSSVQRDSSLEETHWTNLNSLWNLGKKTFTFPAGEAFRAKESAHSNADDAETYFNEFLNVLSVSTTCDAVLDSYHYPSKVQVALVEVYSAMWPYLEFNECCAVLDTLVWPQFPPEIKIHDLLKSWLPHTASAKKDSKEAAVTASCSLKDVLPPGAHPNVLLQLLEWVHAMVICCPFQIGCHEKTLTEGTHLPSFPKCTAKEEEEDTFLEKVFTRFIKVIGGLLQLQHVSEERLARQASGGSFNLSGAFFTTCLEHLRVVIRSGLLPPGTERRLGNTSTRHSGVIVLVELYTQLLSLASTRAVSYDSETCLTSEKVPDSLRAAIDTLDSLTNTLCEFAQQLVENLDDISGATKIAEALVRASMTTSPLLKNIANRCLVTLDDWSAVMMDSVPPTKGNGSRGGAHGSDPDGRLAKEPTHEWDSSKADLSDQPSLKFDLSIDASRGRKHFCAVVRDAIHARSQILMHQYLVEPHNTNTSRLMRDLLLSICQRFDALPPLIASTIECGGMREESASEETKTEWSYARELLSDLVKIVAYTDERESRTHDAVLQEKELRRALSDALLSVHRVLGII